MENSPEQFCEFQREYLSDSKIFICGIYDWQCARPHCSYRSKSEMTEKGCDIARVEGQRIKQFLGDPNAKPPEIAKHFEIRFRGGPLIMVIAPESR